MSVAGEGTLRPPPQEVEPNTAAVEEHGFVSIGEPPPLPEPAFEPWPKIPRLHRAVTITEKIDGTNAAVVVTQDGRIFAQSRTRFITPEEDNFGFAQWVEENKEQLLELGQGRHYGEWYGRGIQRGYGMEDRRFALFNTHRWKDERPECCEVVPILYGTVTAKPGGPDRLSELVGNALDDLEFGSRAAGAAPSQPAEGVIVFHHAANQMFKVTLENDEAPKGAQNA